MSLNEIVSRATSRAGTIRVSNALNPLLWMSALAPAVLLIAYLFRSDPVLEYFIVGLGAFPLVCVAAAYFTLLFRDPDRLQSEAFVLRQQELAIFERKADYLADSPAGDLVERLPLERRASEGDDQ